MEKKIRTIQHPATLHLKKKRIAAYARVSSGKDAMLHSLSAQVSYYSGLIQRHADWEFAGVYADEALTGTKDTRTEFQRLLADCRTGKIDMVITKSISRFARNTVTLLEATRELKAIGVDVFFEEQNIHTLSGEGEMILTLLASVAQEESRTVSENCKWRIRRQFKNGELARLRGMYGYRIHRGIVEIASEQAAVVRRIFREYVGGTGSCVIARRLREEGIPPFGSGQWTQRRITDILKNEKYTGNALLQKKYVTDHLTKKLVRNKGRLPMYYAEGTHPAIIDQTIFDQAQTILAANAAKVQSRHTQPKRYPFSGLIVCGNCGKSYSRIQSRGKAYWVCDNYRQLGKAVCFAKRIPEDMLTTLTAQILGLDELDEKALEQQVSKIRVPAPNKLVYLFSDGHEAEAEWQDRSRSESWTEEMKQKAREKATGDRRNI